MKRRKIYVIFMAVIMVLVSGCGSKTETGNNIADSTEASEIDETVNEESVTTEESSDEIQDTDSLITEKDDSELDLKEYYFSFEDRTVGSTGDEVFSRIAFEDVGDGFYYETTGKVSIYAPNGVRMGYIKENVDFGVMGACGDWCYFYLDTEIRYARLSDIEANSLGPEELDAISDEIIAEEMAKAQPQPQTTIPAEQNPSQGNISNTATEEPASVPATSDKYTPDEAVAIYRSLMEAGGMTWSPEIKNVTSWGTGWIYLDKGMPEWAAETNLESAAIGGHGGNSWTKYYLEVTGSDENAVYITEWTSN